MVEALLHSPSNWGYFIAAMLLVEVILLSSFRALPSFWGSIINVWYDKFGIVAILIDVFIVLIGFWLTTWLYPYIFKTTTVELWKFLVLFLIIQIIHDLLFYVLIKSTRTGSNAIFDLMLNYGKTHGVYTILGDSLIVVLSVLLWWLFTTNNLQYGNVLGICLLSLYIIGYVLYSKW
jgi:hypothetical protein